MSIRIKSVCLNQPSDSFLYISSFCPPLYSRSTPPEKFSLGRFCGCLHRKSNFFCLSIIILHSYKQVKNHFCQNTTKFVGECQRLSLSGERLKHFIKVANSTRYQSSSYTLLMNFFMRIKIYINTSVFVKNIYRICKKFFLI